MDSYMDLWHNDKSKANVWRILYLRDKKENGLVGTVAMDSLSSAVHTAADRADSSWSTTFAVL